MDTAFLYGDWGKANRTGRATPGILAASCSKAVSSPRLSLQQRQVHSALLYYCSGGKDPAHGPWPAKRSWPLSYPKLAEHSLCSTLSTSAQARRQPTMWAQCRQRHLSSSATSPNGPGLRLANLTTSDKAVDVQITPQNSNAGLAGLSGSGTGHTGRDNVGCMPRDTLECWQNQIWALQAASGLSRVYAKAKAERSWAFTIGLSSSIMAETTRASWLRVFTAWLEPESCQRRWQPQVRSEINGALDKVSGKQEGGKVHWQFLEVTSIVQY